MERDSLGWEGNRLKTYRWGILALAILPGLAVALAVRLYRLLVELKPVDLSLLPPDAILYGFHPDLLPTCLHLGYLLQYPGRGYLLGSHTFTSYMMNVGFWLEARGMGIHRYDPRDRGGRARAWLLRDLERNPRLRMGIYTDSGGPYERVRDSLVTLAKESKRPLVAIRVRASRSIRILGHVFPLPGSRIEVQLSEPIAAEDATKLKLQRAIDNVGRVNPKGCRRTRDRRTVHRGADRRKNAGRRMELSKV